MKKRLIATMLCLIMLFSVVPSMAYELRYKDTGTRVGMLQNQLKYLGYYNGPISNKFGYELYLAVRSFQRVNGLKVDGIAGPNTLAVINSLDGKTPIPKPSPDVKRLRYGDKNEDVKKVQERLKELGYLADADDEFDIEMYNAVTSFQKNNNLRKDGIVGEHTWSVLFGSGTKPKTPADPKSAGFRLQYNDRSAYVTQLKNKLVELGYFNKDKEQPISDVYTYYTVECVRAFQKNNGLKSDGIVGSLTWNKLFSGSAKPAGSGAPSPSVPAANIRLQYKQRDPQVKLLKNRLAALGYYSYDSDPVKETDLYSYRTVSSVRSFQDNNGLKADGIAGPNTLSKLYGPDAKAKPSGDTTTSKKPFRLQYKDKNSNVTKLQQRLVELKFFDTSREAVSGEYTYYTVTCVEAFQKSKGLQEDGVVGPKTWEALGFK
ncbi:MAG: peptidoglycan-binding domain-containing protein [Christensenellales bacterium]|nr:hypothetical protein [Christensenellaceae bacterium]